MNEFLVALPSSIVAIISAFFVYQNTRAANRDKKKANELQGAKEFWMVSVEEARKQIRERDEGLEAARKREQYCLGRVRKLEKILLRLGQDVPNDTEGLVS